MSRASPSRYGRPHAFRSEHVWRVGGPRSLVRVQVECARKCNMLIRLVQERRQVLDELDTATATLQRSAQLAPRVSYAAAGPKR